MQRFGGFGGQAHITYGMKKLIFSIYVLFLVVLIGMSGCKEKEHQSLMQGVIVGLNYGSCATCGGFYINRSNDTVKTSASYYVLNWPDALDSVIDQYYTQYNKDHSPIYVSFDWQPVGQTMVSNAAGQLDQGYRHSIKMMAVTGPAVRHLQRLGARGCLPRLWLPFQRHIQTG